MTPEQITAIIHKVLEENGYALNVAIVDPRNGLDLTRAVAEQWGYTPVVNVVKKPEGENVTRTIASQ